MADTAGDGTNAVGVFPGGFDAGLKLRDGHAFRLKDDVLGVVELPVFGQDAALGFEAQIERGVGERRDDGEAREVDVRGDGEFGGLQEDVGFVVIKAEDKAALEGDAVVMEALHDAGVVFGGVEAFVREAEIGG